MICEGIEFHGICIKGKLLTLPSWRAVASTVTAAASVRGVQVASGQFQFFSLSQFVVYPSPNTVAMNTTLDGNGSVRLEISRVISEAHFGVHSHDSFFIFLSLSLSLSLFAARRIIY